MEIVLISVTLVSLALAATMSVVAWKLLRDARDRAAARVDALEAMAFSVPAAQSQNSARELESAVIRETDAGVSPAAAVLNTEARQPDIRAVDPDALPHVVVARMPRSHDVDLRLRPSSEEADIDLPIGARERPFRPGATSAAMFERQTSQPDVAKRWLAVAAVALVVGAGFAMTSALKSPEIVAAVAASRDSAQSTPPRSAHRLELLSLRHTSGPEQKFVVTGLVQNPSDGSSLERIDAVLYLFDEQGRYFAGGRAPIDVTRLLPGGESPFVVEVSATTNVARYRVGFRAADGSSLTHVDRRGELPSGTSGDALTAGSFEAEAPRAVPLGAAR